MYLKEIVKASGLKQSYLARKCGVSVVAVSQWVNGKAKPNPQHLERLSELLKVPVQDLKNMQE